MQTRFGHMAKIHIKRFLHRNGQIFMELRTLGGRRHGISRTWHQNGKLAEEQSFRHGLLHGVTRQWNREGKLLGTFEMKRGTGLQKYFHENGKPKLEITTANGQFHGRTRMWMRDGTQSFEKFYILDRDVSRVAYLKATASHPDWPQYADEPRGRVMREGNTQERKKTELFFESILDQPHEEVVAWLAAEEVSRPRSLGIFRTAKAAIRFVESLYAAGAQKVIAGPIYSNKKGWLFVDWLFIQLPKGKTQRRALRHICEEFIRKRDGALLPEKDIHEKYLCFNLAP
jgi:hypothetical protein